MASSIALREALSVSSLIDPDGSWSLCGASGSAIISEMQTVIAFGMVDISTLIADTIDI